MEVVFGPQVCGTLAEAALREWLVADGLGGYAMGTVAGLRTRRYHGLLVVAGATPGQRSMGLAALEPVLVIGDRRVRLASDEWAGGVVDPQGNALLESFDLEDGVPRWRWSIGAVVLEREIAFDAGRAAVAVVHRLLRADRGVRLELTPLCTWRDAHGERFAGGDPALAPVAGGFEFEGRYRVLGPGWQPGGEWYRGVRYREEAARGLADTEDLWAGGRFVAELGAGETMEVHAVAAGEAAGAAAGVGTGGGAGAGAGTGGGAGAAGGVGAAAGAGTAAGAGAAIVSAVRRRARDLVKRSGAHGPAEAALVLAADQLVVSTSGGVTACAGYPWFGEWSRDAMTAYEGLFLATARATEGRGLLTRAAATLSEGMLANTTDSGVAQYNTADATLWFVHAIGRHVAATGDIDLAGELIGAVADALEHHLRGTRFGIAADPADGLLRQGADGLALTWMDARVGDVPVTPRAGKAVEINALWINALRTAAWLSGKAGRSGDRWRTLADQAAASFAARFARADGRGLLDVVDGPSGDDPATRPNQLLAVSLPHAPLADAAVVEACRADLLTPLGLRSLAPGDPAYHGSHHGGPAERDSAYHQGTVWPWLIGPYVEGALRTGVDPAGATDGLVAHLHEWGLGSVSETADGDAPHLATGCPFQAWSVAELLRSLRLLREGLLDGN
jgi:glycogen debranching enzyme